MATIVNFYGKTAVEPGSYATTIYNPTSTRNVAEFGNTVFVDTGLNVEDHPTIDGQKIEFAGGSGINGTLAKGGKAVYTFEELEDLRSFLNGGKVTDIAEKLFVPVQGTLGVPKLFYGRAATTTPATMVLANVDNTDPDNPVTTPLVTLTCKNEGLCGNATGDTAELAEEGNIKVGYAGGFTNMGTNSANQAIFAFTLYRGNYQGTDNYGEPYGTKSWENSGKDVITYNENLTTIGDLIDFLQSDKTVRAHFNVAPATDVDRDKLIENTSLLTNWFITSGGTTEYLSGTEYDDFLEAIEEYDFNFVLAGNVDAQTATDPLTNGKMFTFLKNDAKFTAIMMVAGGRDDSDLFINDENASSQSVARYYDSGQVCVIHGSPIVLAKNKSQGEKELDPIYLAAAVTGLNAGQQAQTPITFKRIGYESFVYDLKKKERVRALQAGIIQTRLVSGVWCVNQGVTSLQDNTQTISIDGQSLELSIELIKAQINKELILDGQRRFTGQTAAQSSPQAVKNFTETKLQSLEASMGADNLLISWRNVNVRADNGDYYITYDFVPNVPVNKTFFVGNMLDFSVTV